MVRPAEAMVKVPAVEKVWLEESAPPTAYPVPPDTVDVFQVEK